MGDGVARHTPTLTGKLIARLIVCDLAISPHIGETISNLTLDYQWLEVGDTIDEITSACWLAVDSYYGSGMVGTVAAFIGTSPIGWLDCDGTTYDAADYPELDAALDDVYRNTGAGTFTLPDMSGYFLAGVGSGESIGDTGGEASHTLTENEIPAHTHTYLPPAPDIDLNSVGAPDIIAASVGSPTSTGSTGGSAAHENRPPYLAVTFAIFAAR